MRKNYYVNTQGLLFSRQQVLQEIVNSKKSFYSLTSWKTCLKECFITDSLEEAKQARTDAIEMRMERSGLC